MRCVVATPLQRCVNRVYRQIGRLSARVLGSSPIVESVYIHRSVAADEASFGRSDIDLLVVVRQPPSGACDGSELAALGRTVRRMHAILPVVGQMEVHDPRGLQDWCRSDPYRASIERRSTILVYGKPFEFTSPPIRTEHAIRRAVVPVSTYLTAAVKERNRRNLRKFSLDVWNAYATATHQIAEPFLARQETDHYRLTHEGRRDGDSLGDPDHALSFIFGTIQRLHDTVMLPLEKIRSPLIFRVQLPPGFRERTFVVLPKPGFPLPPEAFDSSAFLWTPEALDLFTRYASAFFYWVLPPEVKQLGISQPDATAFVRSCRHYCDTHKIRYPIFMKNNDIRSAVGRVMVLRHAVRHLRHGHVPPPVVQAELREALANPPACSDYYDSVFPELYREAEQLWEELRWFPDVAAEPSPASATPELHP
jgi:hypothetical protein